MKATAIFNHLYRQAGKIQSKRINRRDQCFTIDERPYFDPEQPIERVANDRGRAVGVNVQRRFQIARQIAQGAGELDHCPVGGGEVVQIAHC